VSDGKHSALTDRHIALGARLVPFGGWSMPLQYDGVVAEHRACRESGVVFDVSHLGSVSVSGPGAMARLQAILTNDLAKVAAGQTQYTHLLNDAGGVIDDLIVWRLSDDAWMVMPNASNTGGVLGAIGAVGPDVDVLDVTLDRTLLAVQGPDALRMLGEFWPDAGAVKRNTVETLEFSGVPAMVAGTGYTGEPGVEIHIGSAAAAELWDQLLAAGLKPAGLGARDTLRLEKGYPLHGHELGPEITPLEAGLGFVIAWDKPNFVGKEALVSQQESGLRRKLTGLLTTDRKIAREGTPILLGDRVVGSVTSGNFSPTLGVAVAMGFIEPRIDVGTAVSLDIRGRLTPATIVATPFV